MKAHAPRARAHPARVTARVPGSKSITNRALVLAAAASGPSRLSAPLVSDDTVAFRDALGALGAEVRTVPGDGHWTVTGLGGGPRGGGRVWCADAGTAARFLPPFAAAGRGRYAFDGSAQLRARPLGPLVRALARLGAVVDGPETGGPGTGGPETGGPETGGPGDPATAAGSVPAPAPDPGTALPLTVHADGLAGGPLTLPSGLSSQFLSGLLMAAPLMRAPLDVRAESLVSRPYVDMTLALMRRFGAHADFLGDRVTVAPGGYTATDLAVEPDASTASYFFAAAAVTGRSVTVPGLGTGSLQGDLGFVEVLRRTGARVEVTRTGTTVTGGGALRGGFEVDMGNISDTYMTLAAIAPLADAPITIHGIGHARLKESDRLAVVAENLAALGVTHDVGPDRVTVVPGPTRPARISCHRDHRIAMAFSVLGLRAPGITLDDPGCVSKTFPGFHTELRRLFPGHADTTTTEEHR